jgi:RNA polymerase sigma-70 factor (ECF subfamily)
MNQPTSSCALGRRSTAPPTEPDEELVRRAAGGDRSAFGALLERHYDRLLRVAWRHLGSSHDAEDIVQEVCCGLADKMRLFRGEAKVTTWLIGIVVNACRDHRRRSGAFARLRDRFGVVAGLQAHPDGRDLHRARWLASGIARLSPEVRSAVILVAGEGLSHAEAAGVLGCAESTVSWRMHEARKRLRAQQLDEVLDV